MPPTGLFGYSCGPGSYISKAQTVLFSHMYLHAINKYACELWRSEHHDFNCLQNGVLQIAATKSRMCLKSSPIGINKKNRKRGIVISS